MHFLINALAVLALVRAYYHVARKRENAASFLLFGIGVFLVTALLHTAEISMGFAFGLFAIFSMLRYRTESIGIKEMTYLFLVITMALLAAVGDLHPLELAGVDLVLVALALALEKGLILPLYGEREIEYERVENISAGQEATLIADLKQRTGLDIRHVEVVSISYLRDTALLRCQYKP
jgi:hypothetical protein